MLTATGPVHAEGTTATATRYRAPQVILFSADVERAASFYRALGFAELYRRPLAGEPTHVDLALDGYAIGIAAATDGGRTALTLWADDVEAAFAELTANGAPPLVEPRAWPGGLVIAWIADPDGNPIQLVQSR